MNNPPLDDKNTFVQVGVVAGRVIAGLSVKPLEFTFDEFTEIQTALPMDGINYNVKETFIGGWAWRSGDMMFRDVRTEKEAKAACWQDWLKRIGQALC